MTARSPAHHFRRGNVFYFRQPIPADIQHHFSTREVCFSLRTEIGALAARLAAELSMMIGDTFRRCRDNRMNSPENDSTQPTTGVDSHSEEFQRRLKQTLREARLKIQISELRDERDEMMFEAQSRVNAEKRAHAADVAQLQAAHNTEIVRKSEAHATEVSTMAIHHAQTVAEIATRQHDKKPSILLSEAVEYMVSAKMARNEWTTKTESAYRADYALLIRIIGDRLVSDISNQDVTDYTNTLRRLPANINKSPRFVGKSIEDILAMNPEPMSLRSINKNIEHASSLFIQLLADDMGGIVRNPFAKKSVKSKKTGDAKKRKPFTDGELASLLTHPVFLARQFNNPYSYWAIPLALFTGARVNELAQLHLNDFVEIDGVHCIDINDDEAKRLKTPNSKRLVPIHNELIRLGILDYVGALKSAGYARLFPEISATRDGYGATISKWFARHRADCGITDKLTKVFHSFRHTAITRLFNVDAPMGQIAALVGHEMGLVTFDVYHDKDDSPQARKRTIDRLIYPADVLALLPTVHEVTLNAYHGGCFWTAGKIVKKEA
jgi:integrase